MEAKLNRQKRHYLPWPFPCEKRSSQFGAPMAQAQKAQQEDQGDDAWDGITEEMQQEVLRRIDVLSEAKKYGFVPLGPPDAAGWVPGRISGKPCGLLNVGWGPERGNFIECAGPCPVRGERVH